jgi:hypothetical protein
LMSGRTSAGGGGVGTDSKLARPDAGRKGRRGAVPDAARALSECAIPDSRAWTLSRRRRVRTSRRGRFLRTGSQRRVGSPSCR